MATHSEAVTIGQIEARNVTRLTGLKCHHDPQRRSAWEIRLAKTWGSGQGAEWEFGKPICRGCARDIDVTPFERTVGGVAISLPVTVCEDCMQLVREHYNGATEPTTKEVSLTPKWDEKCPPRFKEVIEGTLPSSVDLPAFRRVIAWRPTDRKGIAMKGPSGSGKTTAFWALARELERERTAPVVLTAVEMGRVLSQAARDIEEVGWLCRCRVLMIDDLGKEKATPAVAAMLWEVLDKRYGLGLPLVVSTRFSGDELRLRFGEECLGDDIIRRLNELCTGVKFALPEAKPQPAAAA